VGYLELEACWTRRGHAGGERVRGEGFVAAAYRHRRSRAGDPQLHTHVVVANLTRADGRFTALDARSLFVHKSAVGAVYRAVLRAEVRERLAWVSWSRVSRGLFEIDGMPAGVLRHFSQRRVEIEQRAAELVGAGRSLSRDSMQAIALAARRPKTAALDGELWRDDARARAAEHGLGPMELRALLTRPRAVSPRPDRRAVIARLSGAEGLTGSHNTFVRRHALAELAGEFADGVRVRDLERATDVYLADPSVRPIATEADGEVLFTTEGLLRCERTIVSGADRCCGEQAAVVPEATVDAALAGATLNPGHAAAVRALATGGDGVDTVQALAGTGKTTMLRTLADAYARAGYQVIGAAPTARAARELRDVAGIQAGTLHALAAELDRRRGFAPGPDHRRTTPRARRQTPTRQRRPTRRDHRHDRRRVLGIRWNGRPHQPRRPRPLCRQVRGTQQRSTLRREPCQPGNPPLTRKGMASKPQPARTTQDHTGRRQSDLPCSVWRASIKPRCPVVHPL
jgi:ATP-dependent exoDNAse (exonuclease V) alpha subunit